MEEMAGHKEARWMAIYQTPSPSDADLVRTTLEVAGFRVSVEGGATAPGVFVPGYDVPSGLSVSVPAEDAEDARDYLRNKTSLLHHTSGAASAESTPPTEGLRHVAEQILELRRQHEVAACKYCGIATLDVSETELDSRMNAFLRSAGLGVNSATFSEYEPGERICADCAGHEVSCEACGRVFDAFLDQGQYQRAAADEAYVCSGCRSRLEDELQADRDW